MKKTIILLVSVLFFTFSVPADEAVVETSDLKIGSVKFPRAFIHDGKNYNKGVYKVTLMEKEGEFLFNVFNPTDELLFEEVAIVKLRKSRIGKRKYLLRKNIMRGYEYFRIKVTKPDKVIMGYFLLAKNTTKTN
ncbi:MAG: hypothetical protein KAS21_05735 [Candidatus Aminicenantes bacterium]|nr:hypothetical protein [Candidatus Aminicenantes bacterium]MCK5004566.1 hypothetical protein [Candidatus Aminicenantes bacterium]